MTQSRPHTNPDLNQLRKGVFKQLTSDVRKIEEDFKTFSLDNDVFVSQDASAVVSIVCGTNKIAWAHVDRGMTLLDWQQLGCPNFLRGTYMASAYLNDVSLASRVCGIADILKKCKQIIRCFQSRTFVFTSW